MSITHHGLIERCGRPHGHALNHWRILVVGDTPRDVDAGRAVGRMAAKICSAVLRVFFIQTISLSFKITR